MSSRISSGGTPSASNLSGNKPAAIQNADGRLEVFAQGTDNAVWHTWQTEKNTNSWYGRWVSLGHSIVGGPTVARNEDGRLEVFVFGQDYNIWHTWQISPNGDWIGTWHQLADIPTGGYGLQVIQNADGRLEAFLSIAGEPEKTGVYHTWQVEPNGNWIDGWDNFGLAEHTYGARARLNATGKIEVFATRGRQNSLVHISQTEPNGTWERGWSLLNNFSPAGPIYSVAQNADGRLEVFFKTSEELGRPDLWHTRQIEPNGDRFDEGFEIATPERGIFEVDVASNADGRLEVFGVVNEPTGNKLNHTWQYAPSNGLVEGWATRGGYAVVRSYAVAQNADGRLEVFATGPNNTIWNTRQTAPNNGWSI